LYGEILSLLIVFNDVLVEPFVPNGVIVALDIDLLLRVDGALNQSWSSAAVAGLYADGPGRPGIDTEAAVWLMLAGFFQRIVHHRRLTGCAS
jgi:hypothetical protein